MIWLLYVSIDVYCGSISVDNLMWFPFEFILSLSDNLSKELYQYC